MNVIACIEDPLIIKKILTHLDENVPVTEAIQPPDCRAPPQPGFSIWAEKPDQLTHRLLLGDTRQGCAWPVCRNRYEILVFTAQQANQEGGNG